MATLGERPSFELVDEPMLIVPPPWRVQHNGSRPFLLHRDGRRETVTWRYALDHVTPNPGGSGGARDLYGHLVGTDE